MLPDGSETLNSIDDTMDTLPGDNKFAHPEGIQDFIDRMSEIGQNVLDTVYSVSNSIITFVMDSLEKITNIEVPDAIKNLDTQQLSDDAVNKVIDNSAALTDIDNVNVEPQMDQAEQAIEQGAESLDKVASNAADSINNIDSFDGFDDIFGNIIDYFSHNGLIGMFCGNCTIIDVLYAMLSSLLIFAIFFVIIILIGRGTNWIVQRLIGTIFGSEATNIITTWLTYPGVVYHELSHALFAFLSGAKVTNIHLWPSKNNGSAKRTLGYVTFVPQGSLRRRNFQSAIASVAPSVTGTAGVIALLYFAFTHPTMSTGFWLIWIYAMICLGLHSDMSDADMKNLRKGLLGTIITMAIIFLLVPINLGGMWNAFVSLFS